MENAIPLPIEINISVLAEDMMAAGCPVAQAIRRTYGVSGSDVIVGHYCVLLRKGNLERSYVVNQANRLLIMSLRGRTNIDTPIIMRFPGG